MNKNQSTEAQRNYIASLTRGMDNAQIEAALAPAFAWNSNRPLDLTVETLNQGLRRITKVAASRAIDSLKNAKVSA